MDIKFTKECTKCGFEKDLEEFGAQLSNPDLHKNICKVCFSKINSKRYQKKKQEMRENAVKWRENNPEKYRAIQQKHKFKNKFKEDKERFEKKYQILNEQKKDSGQQSENPTARENQGFNPNQGISLDPETA